jgi:hypothetical protein
MTGHRSFDDLRHRMSPERRVRNDAATKALLQEPASKRADLSAQEADSDPAHEEISSAASAK